MDERKRERRFVLRIDPEIDAALVRLAAITNSTRSEVVRVLIQAAVADPGLLQAARAEKISQGE